MREIRKHRIVTFHVYFVDIRLTFNYPGTKRALINFATTISKIDGRTMMSRDVNTFIANSLLQDQRLLGVPFKDPIQGIEPVQRYNELQEASHVPQRSQNLEESQFQEEESITKTLPNRQNEDIMPVEYQRDNVSQRNETTLQNKQIMKSYDKSQKLRIDYEDGMYSYLSFRTRLRSAQVRASIQ